MPQALLQKLSSSPATAPQQFTDLLCRNLSPDRFAGWRRVLSSIATTESYEGLVLDPILRAARHASAAAYLRVHANDEQNHSLWVKTYLHKNFDYKKTSATWSDRLFYETLLPAAAGLVRMMPIIGIAVLYAYEQFSVRLYQRLKIQAQADGLLHLAGIFAAIQHDEGRHIAGLEVLSGTMAPQGRAARFVAKGLLHILLQVVRMDLYFGRWNILNRELADHIEKLGIRSESIDQDVKTSMRITKSRVSLMKQSRTFETTAVARPSV